MADGEIWFERWLWSYMPCHWKGWLFLAVVTAAALAATGLSFFVSSALGHAEWGDWAELGVFAVAFIVLQTVSSKRSRPKGNGG